MVGLVKEAVLKSCPRKVCNMSVSKFVTCDFRSSLLFAQEMARTLRGNEIKTQVLEAY